MRSLSPECTSLPGNPQGTPAPPLALSPPCCSPPAPTPSSHSYLLVVLLVQLQRQVHLLLHDWLNLLRLLLSVFLSLRWRLLRLLLLQQLLHLHLSLQPLHVLSPLPQFLSVIYSILPHSLLTLLNYFPSLRSYSTVFPAPSQILIPQPRAPPISFASQKSPASAADSSVSSPPFASSSPSRRFPLESAAPGPPRLAPNTLTAS